MGTVLGQRDGYAISTLGEFCVFRGAERMPLGPARERALLVYLAMGVGRSFQRDTLVGLLWDRRGSGERRHGLSQLLYSLRHRYPLLELVRTRDTVRLEGGVSSIDALELLAAIEAGDVETACELFGGQFLEGFYIEAASGFEEWRESMTRTLNGAGSRALRARLAHADAEGHWWIVERTANQLLELDPYDEQVHAVRIRSIAADGDHARVLREIDRAVDLFRRDLGQLPGADLRELIRRIGSGSTVTKVEFQDPPAISRFVGRTAEFRELRHAWSAVTEGRSVAIAVCGEAGIGKSRMCLQLLRVAAIEGGRVLDGRCFESASKVPYGGICQALSGIRDADFALLAPHWRTALAGLLPELSPSGSDAAPAVESGTDGGRRQLFEAVVQLIRAMAQHGPIALFVDDLQWADASTTDLLHYLIRAWAEEPVLILVAVRPEELPPSALSQLVDGFRTITVGPLEDEDAAELITALDRSQSRGLPASTQRKILKQSAGRPFLIVELVRYLGTHDAELQKWADGTIDDLPAAVEALLARRLRALSEPASHTVDVLAVLGGEATMTLLERAGRISSRELVAALEELQYRQIIQETGSAYTFTHDLMREAVERRLSTARRRWLNKTSASALQTMPRAQLGAIALHMQAAGEGASAYSYALQAASQSQSLFAHSETTFFLRLAVTTAPDLDKRFIALDRLCRHLYSLADLPAVRTILSQLRPWYAGRRDRHGMLMAAVAELDSALYNGKSPATELKRRARALAELIDEPLDTTESPAVGLILQTSQTAYDAGQKEFITTFSDAIHKRASRGPVNLNRVRHLSTASMAYGLYISASGGYARAMTALGRAMEIADPASELAARLACGATGTLGGVYADAHHHFARAWRLSADDALKHMRRQVIINHAVLLMEMGRFDEAAKLLEDAVDDATIHDRVFLFANLGLVGLEQRDWNGVSKSARELEETNRVLQAWWARVAVSMLKGFAALGNGEVNRARSIGSELSHMIDAGSEAVAGMLDSSYTNILLARVGLLGRNAEETAAGLKRAADASRSTNVGAAARLDIECARTLKGLAPDTARDIACDVLQWATESGATVAAERAAEILASPTRRNRVQDE